MKQLRFPSAEFARRARAACLTACLVLGALAALAPVRDAAAQAWPARPVKLVVPLPPGSGMDLLARALAQKLTGVWNQPVVVENRPGASTIVATEAVAKSPADGYTLLFGLDTGFTVNPHLFAKLPYDAVRDFQPITLVTSFAVVLVAHPSVPAGSVAELIALAKSQPGKITYGSIGSGSQMHLLSAMLENKADIRMTHVPYKGIPQMTLATLAGETQLTWVGVFTARPHVQAGKLKALGYSGTKRTTGMPDVPTLAELGYPDVEMSVWYGFLAPAGTPRPIVDRIHADVLKVMADPEVRERDLLGRGYEPSGLGPEEFAAYMRRESAQRAVMVRVSGAKVE
jgi:tripartite-type tricarboxylate transporter receptor subunit TctC